MLTEKRAAIEEVNGAPTLDRVEQQLGAAAGVAAAAAGLLLVLVGCPAQARKRVLLEVVGGIGQDKGGAVVLLGHQACAGEAGGQQVSGAGPRVL